MPETLNIELVNNTSSDTVYAYITGLALDNNNSWFLLQADGKTPFYPTSPSSIGTPIPQDCAILLGPPGSSRTITIPHLAGGRIYLSLNSKLTFFLNPGPALVEPSVTNPSDPNINTLWAFCEFTWNSDQLYANISYVDFVSLPISLALTTASGAIKQVHGLGPTGLASICAGLEAQAAKDGQGWASLIVKGPDGALLRVLSPNQGIVTNPALFANYFEPFVAAVWEKYAHTPLSIDYAPGATATGTVAPSSASQDVGLVVDDTPSLSFARPTTADIFSAASGPFVTGSDPKRNAIIPRLNAELNRSTLLDVERIPTAPERHYVQEVTNHYARLVHAANVDGRGYAHPYDDVAPEGGKDQSGFVNDGQPKGLRVAVGGGG